MRASALELLVLALALCRATRLVTTDDITRPLRGHLYAAGWHMHHDSITARQGSRHAAARWLHALVICPWCVSIWGAAIEVAVFRLGRTIAWDGAALLALSAVAGAYSERT